MRNLRTHRCFAVWALAAAALVAPGAFAQDLPKGEQVLDKYIEVTGGKDAYEKIKSRVTHCTLDTGALGIKGTVTMYQASPNKSLTETDLAGVGKQEEGTDGTVVWEKSTVNGPRIKDGVEKASYLRRHALDSEVNWRKYYTNVECTGMEKIDGKDCFKLELTPKEGAKETQFFDRNTGLLVKSVAKEKTPFGEVVVENIVSEYKKFDGLTLPTKFKQKVLTNEFDISIDKVEHNAKIPDDRFKLPDDIKKLVEKEKK